MYYKNGILVKGSPPKHGEVKPQKVITHRSQRSQVNSSMRRLDALLRDGRIRICIKRSLGGLGDIIMATPIARGAKRKYPKCHVTFAVPTDYGNGDLAELLYHIPYIDEIIDYRICKRDDYDAFSDITQAGLPYEKPYTTFKHRIDLFAEAAGIPLFGETLPIYVSTKEEESWAQDFVERTLEGKKYKGKIAIQLRSNDPKRTWPAEHVRSLISLAKDAGYESFLFEWGPTGIEDGWEFKGCNPVFNYKIRNVAAIMKQCDVLLCPDSSLLHLGGALNMKIVSLFGNMPPASRISYYPNAIALVNKRLACLGCVYAACSNSYYCMQSIKPQAVLDAIEDVLDREHVSVTSNFDEELVISSEGPGRKISTFRI